MLKKYLLIVTSLFMLLGCSDSKPDEMMSSGGGMKCGAGKCGANMFDGSFALAKKKKSLLSQMRDDDKRKGCVVRAQSLKVAYDCVRDEESKRLTLKCGANITEVDSGGMKCGGAMQCGAAMKCGGSMKTEKLTPDQSEKKPTEKVKPETTMSCGGSMKCGGGMKCGSSDKPTEKVIPKEDNTKTMQCGGSMKCGGAMKCGSTDKSSEKVTPKVESNKAMQCGGAMKCGGM
jgi:hypothetical protein